MRSSDDVRLSADSALALAAHPVRLAVLCRVLWRARTGECFASLATLAADGRALSVRSVRDALAELVRDGYLTAITEHRKTTRYQPGARCPRKPQDSVFLPRSVWGSCKPTALAYWVVRAALGHGDARRCHAEITEAGRAASMSRSTAYRTHRELVTQGHLETLRAVPKSTKASPKSCMVQSQKRHRKVSNGAHEYGSLNPENMNTDLSMIPICNSYSSGDGWEGAKGVCDAKKVDSSRSGRGLPPSSRQADGNPRSQSSGGVRDSVGPRDCEERQERHLRLVPPGCAEATSDICTSPASLSGAVSGRPRADFLTGWRELRERAGKSLGLRAALTSTGLPSLEETLIVGAFSELSDQDTHLLPVVGEWIAAGGLSWHSEKKLSPWRFLARNLADCIARAACWKETGGAKVGRGRFNPEQTEDDDAIIHAATMAALRVLPGGLKS